MRKLVECPMCAGMGYINEWFGDNCDGVYSKVCGTCGGVGKINVPYTNKDRLCDWDTAGFLTQMCEAITDCNKCPLSAYCNIAANSRGAWEVWLQEEHCEEREEK